MKERYEYELMEIEKTVIKKYGRKNWITRAIFKDANLGISPAEIRLELKKIEKAIENQSA